MYPRLIFLATVLLLTACNEEARQAQGFSLPEGAELDLLTRGSFQAEMAEASDIANVVCFVASDDASKMNGSILSVDGGEVAG